MARGVYKRTPEHNAANSKARAGVSLSPEHIAAIKKGIKNSDAVKAAAETAAEAMRGGLDLVWHHVSYDFGRPEALRVRIIRSFHGQIHHPKGCKFGTYGYSLID